MINVNVHVHCGKVKIMVITQRFGHIWDILSRRQFMEELNIFGQLSLRWEKAPNAEGWKLFLKMWTGATCGPSSG